MSRPRKENLMVFVGILGLILWAYAVYERAS